MLSGAASKRSKVYGITIAYLRSSSGLEPGRHVGGNTFRDAQALDVDCTRWVPLKKVGGSAPFEAVGGEAGRHRHAEKRLRPTRRDLARLPVSRRDDVLDGMPAERVAENHLVVSAVRLEQHQTKRIAGIEVPDLVEGEPVEQ